MSSEQQGGGNVGRRGFLQAVAGLATLGIGAVITAPGIAYLLAPLLGAKKADAAPVKVASLGGLPVGVPQRVDVVADRVDAWTKEENVRLGSVWLVKRDDKTIECFSTICPHLGCAIDYDDKKKTFACPCHDSVFSLDGKVKSGPSPRPMDVLAVEAKDGDVLVAYQRFRQGTPRKEPI